MAFYKVKKNLVFSKTGAVAIVDEIIELDPEYATEINEKLKDTFPDVDCVLEAVQEETEEVEEQAQKQRNKKAKE